MSQQKKIILSIANKVLCHAKTVGLLNNSSKKTKKETQHAIICSSMFYSNPYSSIRPWELSP